MQSHTWLAGVLLTALVGCTPGSPTPSHPDASGATATGSTVPSASATDTPGANALPDYAIQQALSARSDDLAAELKRPVGKRAWARVSSGYLPHAESYDDRRRKAMKESTSRSRYSLESVLGWTADGEVLVVTESAGSGAAYQIAAYRWRSGKPRQVYQLAWSAFSRIAAVPGATVSKTPAKILSQLTAYRSKGSKPKGVTFADDFMTFESSIAKGGRAHFNETVQCAVTSSPAGSVAWQVPTQGGTLSLVAMQCRTRVVGKDGWQLRHMDWDKAITGDKRYFDRIDCESVYPMAEHVSGTGLRSWSSPMQQPLDVCTGR